jgi:dTDP-4-amino-4,6-dideoxygalactose transaminase
VSNNSKWVDTARFLATQARDNAPHYQHSHIGYNYRLSNILAGVGRGQLLVLDERIKQRRKNFDFYKAAFALNPEIQFLLEPEGFFSNRWLTTAVIAGKINREDIRVKLEKENIESRPLWKPMHMQPIFQGCPAYTNGTSERLFNDGICLPSGSNMTPGELHRVVDVIHSLLSH